MNKLKLSVATLLALGTLSSVNGASLEEAIKNTTVSGYAFGQYNSIFGTKYDSTGPGKDYYGNSYRFRTNMKITSGVTDGYSFSTNIYASQGSGAPYGGQLSKNIMGIKAINDINLMTFYGTKTFEGSASTINAGYTYLDSAFTDTSWDRGIGVSFVNKDTEGLTIKANLYDSWLNDDTDLSFGNNIFMLGVEGDGASFAGVSFKLWLAHIADMVDYMTFGEVGYSMSGFGLKAQMAVTGVNAKGVMRAVGGNKTYAEEEEIAKMRGLYNVQASYSLDSLGVKLGYAGSFGDGYGALMDGNGGFDVGGMFWCDPGYSGYSIVGDGSHKIDDNGNLKSSTLSVLYVNANYGIGDFSFGANYAMTSGNNQVLVNKFHAQKIGSDATFHEVGVSAGYALTKNVSASASYATSFGDLELSKVRATVNYKF